MLFVHVTPEGITDQIPLLKPRHHVVEAAGELADFVPGRDRQGLAVLPGGHLGGPAGDQPDGLDHGVRSQADEHQNHGQAKKTAPEIIEVEAADGSQDLASFGMEHQGPGGAVQPVEADDLALAHEGAVGLLLHLRQHGQLQGILVLPQAVAAGHGRVAVGQVVAVVVHQAGHVALQPARGQDVCHEIIEFDEDGELPQGPAGAVQKLGLEAHHPLAGGVEIFGRRHPGHLLRPPRARDRFH